MQIIMFFISLAKWKLCFVIFLWELKSYLVCSKSRILFIVSCFRRCFHHFSIFIIRFLRYSYPRCNFPETNNNIRNSLKMNVASQQTFLTVPRVFFAHIRRDQTVRRCLLKPCLLPNFLLWDQLFLHSEGLKYQFKWSALNSAFLILKFVETT